MTSSSALPKPDVASLANFRLLNATWLYRSSNIQGMNVADVPRFASLGIKTVLDLRSSKELSHPKSRDRETIQLLGKYFTPLKFTFVDGRLQFNESIFPKDGSTGNYINISLIGWTFPRRIIEESNIYDRISLMCYAIWDYLWRTNYSTGKFLQLMETRYKDIGIVGHYKDFIEFSHEEIKKALLVLCEPALRPLCVCCAVGKDRTGVVVALALSVLGWEPHRICQDYALSQDAVVDLNLSDIPMFLRTAEYSTMDRLLVHITDKYGSVELYLQKIGFGKDAQEKLRRNLSHEETMENN